jgi:23S rRNA (pseudouridine1915-N3)-methyltransferase
MRILIAAIGKAKASPAQQLYLDYIKRLPWKVECKEFDVKHADDAQRKTRECERLLSACKGYDRVIALDESGKQFTSREFASYIGNAQQQGNSSLAFLIGGSDGINDAVRKDAHLIWSLGKLTWPHMLVRPLLAEQLYRAWSVLAKHPYHRD